ncbi:YTH domain-containing protein ECT2 [Citrus sinensis]|uniref:YTH domain-containing protein ECT2 n=1 Tax=Citrus sinensis TaxID=2711 RepID=A0ACB8MGC2_CITSI|nr:YTH domain-containing protein ECT2 [Citrus sinensis]
MYLGFEAADLLQNFSLDSETNAVAGHEYGHKGLGDNGSVIYSQNYGYTPYGIYPSTGDVQLQGLQQYHYPSPYYQPNQGSASQGGGSTSVMADKVSLSVESNKDNPMANGPGVSGNGRSKPQRPNYQYPYLDPNSSHGRGGLSTVVPSPSYQDPGYSFDGIHSPITWLDTSIFGGGQSKHNANAGYTSPISHSNNFPSGRNQNHRPHLANFHHTRPTSDAFGYMSQMYANNPMYGHYGNTFRAGPGYGSFGYDSWISGRGWYPVDSKYKPRGRGYGASGSGKENVDGLNELNKGPRAKGFKNQEGFDPATVAAKGQNLKSSESTPEDNLPLIPDKEKYSGEDFPESYSDAKFFIIKSYSEDDVHKSVKYNMWTSTPNGNKKLDAAYREAKEKSSDCPVFLLFSVNASGQFVGVAEMVGPVDFDKTVEYWQQDKWVGCFPLKWLIIKDVPNSSLRHITLENNENKPVTNSRDTQEVSDGKPSDVIIDDKDKDAASAKDRVQKSQEETLVKELALIETIGDVKKLEENGSAATVEDAVKGAKSAVSSGKKGTSNGVGSAC